MGNYLNPGNSGFAGIRNDIYVDEAHLLFDSASKSLLGKIEQVVKLIRSKGGIYFITQSRMGTITEEERKEEIEGSLLYNRYFQTVDRESAYEILEKKVLAERENEEKARKEAEEEKQRQKEEAAAEKQRQKEEAAAEKKKQREEEAARKAAEKKAEAQSKRVKSAMNQTASSAVGTIGREVGNSVGKSLGGSFGKKIGGNVGASLGRGILNTLFKL